MRRGIIRPGLVQIGATGITVKRFGTTFNTVANANEFSSVTIGDYGRLPVRAPSNQAQAGLVADQDHNTYWQPDLDDPLQKWWLEVDLDRAVVARKIRVIFPQTEEARPFEFFSVHVSPGIQVAGAPGKQIAFERVGRPVNNNTKQVVEFDLRTVNKFLLSVERPRGSTWQRATAWIFLFSALCALKRPAKPLAQLSPKSR